MLFRKKSADVLEADLPRVFGAIDTMILVLDAEARVVLFNHKCQEVTGFKDNEVRGKVFWDVLVPEQRREDARAYFNELVSGSFSGTHTIPWLTRKGGEQTISWMSSVLADKGGRARWVVSTGTDITDQTRQNSDLQQLAAVGSYDPNPVVELDRHGRILFLNHSAQSLFDKRRLTGENWRRVMPGLSEPSFERFLRSSSPQRLSHEAKFGGKTWLFEHQSIPERDMVIVYGRDSSESKEAQAKLKEAEKVLGAFLDSLAEPVIMLDQKGVIVDCNTAAEKLTGYRQSELKGKNIARHRLFQRRQVPNIINGKRAAFQELEITRKDNRRLALLVSITQLKQEGRQVLVLIGREVTEQKKLKDELARAQQQLKETSQELDERIELCKELVEKQQGPTLPSGALAKLNDELRILAGEIRNAVYSLELQLPEAGEGISGSLERISAIAGRLEKAEMASTRQISNPAPPTAASEAALVPPEPAPLPMVTESSEPADELEPED